jgi:long-chain acyl-CoA synthetase
LIDVGRTLSQTEILLTGGNGFLGKVFLGLLLDRYPEFKHLHILLRPAGDRSADKRFDGEILRSPAMAKIARKRGDDFLHSRITVWPGDVSRQDCGLDRVARERLRGRVGLVINCAGRVEFLPPIDESFSANVDGVEHVVTLTQELRAKLLDVSTCYVCGAADGLIEETEPIPGFYPRRKGPEDTSFDHAEELRYCRERIRQIYESEGRSTELPDTSGKLLRSKEAALRLIALGKQRSEHWGWVNTYTFAKSLGEQIIAAQEGLDYAIVRPAIIESALRFPFPGWIEGGRTAAPLVLMALGGLKDWPLRKGTPLEIVPVDLVASAILAVSALLLDGRHKPVYQLGTADVNPVLLDQIATLLCAEARRRRQSNGHRPFALALVDPPRRIRFLSEEAARARRVRLQGRINRAETFVAGVRKVFETTRLPGKQSLSSWASALRTLSLQATFREKALEQYLPFMLHNRYIFESENIRTAYSQISEKDRGLIPWDPEHINWEDYWVSNQIEGIQKWVQPEAVREWAFKI